MTMTILPDRCADCGLCAEVCPLSAVRRPTRLNGLQAHEIDPERCTECIGHFGWPRCAVLCRMEAIQLDTDRFETRATLLRKWRRFAAGAEYSEEPPDHLEPAAECGGADA
jgi:ferredoxin